MPKSGSFGIANARLVAPGDPRRSILLRRIHWRGFPKMPAVGAAHVDPHGAALVEMWIAGLRCP